MLPLWAIPLITIGVGLLKAALPAKYQRWLPWIGTVAGTVAGAVGQGHADVTHATHGAAIGLAAVGAWETVGKAIRDMTSAPPASGAGTGAAT